MISPPPNAAPGVPAGGRGSSFFSPPTKKLPWLAIVSGPFDRCAWSAAVNPQATATPSQPSFMP